MLKFNSLRFKDSSLWTLVASNLAILVMALLFHWNVAELLWVYWGQSVIIGLINIFKIFDLGRFALGTFSEEENAIYSRSKVKRFLGLLFISGFFVVHYGLFHLVYAVFISQSDLKLSPDSGLHMKWAFSLFTINHLFSYFKNRSKDLVKIQQTTANNLMGAPYLRIIPMHLTMFVMPFASSGFVLFVFIPLKTFMDALMHIYSHKTSTVEEIN